MELSLKTNAEHIDGLQANGREHRSWCNCFARVTIFRISEEKVLKYDLKRDTSARAKNARAAYMQEGTQNYVSYRFRFLRFSLQ